MRLSSFWLGVCLTSLLTACASSPPLPPAGPAPGSQTCAPPGEGILVVYPCGRDSTITSPPITAAALSIQMKESGFDGIQTSLKEIAPTTRPCKKWATEKNHQTERLRQGGGMAGEFLFTGDNSIWW